MCDLFVYIYIYVLVVGDLVEVEDYAEFLYEYTFQFCIVYILHTFRNVRNADQFITTGIKISSIIKGNESEQKNITFCGGFTRKNRLIKWQWCSTENTRYSMVPERFMDELELNYVSRQVFGAEDEELLKISNLTQGIEADRQAIVKFRYFNAEAMNLVLQEKAKKKVFFLKRKCYT